MSTTVNSYDYSPYWLQTSTNSLNVNGTQTSTVNNSVSVFDDAKSQSTANTNNSVLSDACDDGKDDGKISLWSGICAFGKGIVKSAVNTVTGILSDPKKLLLTAATATLCVVFPPAGVALGVAGAIGGTISLAKSAKTAYDIYNKGGTDAEMKAAIQDAGASTLQIGLSIAGTKASLGAMRGTAGSAMSNLKPKAGFRATAKAFWKDLRTGGRGNGGEGYLATKAFTRVKSNWNSTRGQGVFQRAGKTIGKTAQDAGKIISDARIQRQAQKDYNRNNAKKPDGETVETPKSKYETELYDAKEAQSKLPQDAPKADIDAAKARVDNAQAKFDTYNTKYNSITKTSEQAVTEAKSAVKNAQDAVNKATENGGKATEAQLRALSEAKADLRTARAQARMASSNPITYNAQKFANVATNDAKYSSGFGALTTPVANAVQQTNNADMTLETAQYNAALNNNSFGSVTTSGGHTFNTQFEHRDYAAIAEQANADVMKTLNYYAY